jgi:hypothetical protein
MRRLSPFLRRHAFVIALIVVVLLSTAAGLYLADTVPQP